MYIISTNLIFMIMYNDIILIYSSTVCSFTYSTLRLSQLACS